MSFVAQISIKPVNHRMFALWRRALYDDSMKLENYKSDEPCLACGEARDGYVCFHHLQTQGSGGPDESWNFMSLCSVHHTEIHKIGLNKFILKYPKSHIVLWLTHRKWEFCVIRNKWFHPVEVENEQEHPERETVGS